jgi:hypothetical protein
MDTKAMDLIQKMPEDVARAYAISIIEKRTVRTINQKTAKNRVIYDLQVAPDKGEIVRIMYNQLLASEGLRTTGSAWGKHYDNI